jgi:thiamine biosynthesis lipoprotein
MQMNVKRVRLPIPLALLLSVSILLWGSGCGKTEQTTEEASHRTLFAMDTVMDLRAYGEDADKAISDAVDLINTLDSELSAENEDSPVYALNHAQGEPVEMPRSVLEILDAAEEIYQRSGGALDLSVYPLSELWGFIGLEDSHSGSVPNQEDIDAALEKLCGDRMERQGSKVRIPAGSELGFGAAAKGYTSDRVLQAMQEDGVESAVVSLGGNVQTLGEKPDGSLWEIAIENPVDTTQYAGILSVGETAVVTSGSYQRYFEVNGKRYHHILDPHTGYPTDNGLLSVTVVCDSGLEADCLSTALFVLGREAAEEYWRTYGGFEMEIFF